MPPKRGVPKANPRVDQEPSNWQKLHILSHNDGLRSHLSGYDEHSGGTDEPRRIPQLQYRQRLHNKKTPSITETRRESRLFCDRVWILLGIQVGYGLPSG
ncbi:hypothetical protein RND71_019321 [Anisodus tanguticus]|uniref:Uncharacterized protein n=1 Tax=Anisodus tanguticus TaxID=243964 RepID=A0AAE1VGC4_9SOLA|nr:hypothetical protein RND71_019321 [Anisodus tanguticus]